MTCVEHYQMVGTGAEAVRLCWFEWGADQRASSTVLLLHATGFHARCWDETVRHLDGRHVIAVDMRGHGRSDKKGPYTWETFGNDLTGLVRELELDQLVGVGHSLGGHVLTLVAGNHPQRFKRLLLVDPMIVGPDSYRSHRKTAVWLDEKGEHPVAKRKNFFPDRETMFNNFYQRASYASWQDATLRDYCEYGLLPNPDGAGYVLACPPSVEAAIYLGSAEMDVYERIRQIETPTLVLRAGEQKQTLTEMDFNSSPTWPGLADCFPNGRDVYLPELTHFIPMQAPELVADYIKGRL